MPSSEYPIAPAGLRWRWLGQRLHSVCCVRLLRASASTSTCNYLISISISMVFSEPAPVTSPLYSKPKAKPPTNLEWSAPAFRFSALSALDSVRVYTLYLVPCTPYPRLLALTPATPNSQQPPIGFDHAASSPSRSRSRPRSRCPTT